ncbi:hypothetical protein JD844_032936 [Phrynosoma platyrhinos]|uniref:CD47-like transmembrane domain-containing protein n=1 Tax=Phrynosoma platyrhinos TaxID=52577 RepID=A0ABQ7T5W7_PHRPL|nr:hypothetical protein JD844_032936 [Phrynosoma platyrhinos]
MNVTEGLVSVENRQKMICKRDYSLSLESKLDSSIHISTSFSLLSEGYSSSQRTGLALIVVPAFILVPLLYFLFTSVFEKQPLFAIILVALKAIGYIIAMAGFALCVLACPPKQGSVMIAGLAIIDIVAAIGLIYLIVIGGKYISIQIIPEKLFFKIKDENILDEY